jgi:hypothetical protein
LHEVPDRGFFIVDEVSGSYAVGGYDDFGMHACAEEVDGDDGGALGFVIEAKRLAKQHRATLE